jgi:transposase InsO family protein
MDFVHDALADGRPFRILTVVDQWSRQSPLLEVAARMSGQAVSEALDRVRDGEPHPRSITVDHRTEFQSRALEDWAYRHGVQLDFIRPGKPVENAFSEAFNGPLRDECLKVGPIRIARGREDQDRNVAARLQSASAPQLARRPDPERVRGAMSGMAGGRSSRRF